MTLWGKKPKFSFAVTSVSDEFQLRFVSMQVSTRWSPLISFKGSMHWSANCLEVKLAKIRWEEII